MAIWQFDVCMFPAEAPPPTRGDDGYDCAAVDPLAAAQAHHWLGARWTPQSWMDDFFMYGEDQGCRFDVLVNEDGSAELLARIDLRGPHADFCMAVCQLASQLDCVLFSPELWCPIPVDADALMAAARRSRAARFIRDPRGTLTER